jgi:flagellin
MQEVQDMLNRMVTLATQSANGTYDNDVDRANLQKEVTALQSEINRIADSANFNGIKLLDGSLSVQSAGDDVDQFTAQNLKVVADGQFAEAANKGSYTFDLTSYVLVNTAAGTSTSAVKFTIGGKTVNVTLSAKVPKSGGSYALTSTDVGKIAAAIKSQFTTAAANIASQKVSWDANASGMKLTISLVKDPSTTVADAINGNAMNFSVQTIKDNQANPLEAQNVTQVVGTGSRKYAQASMTLQSIADGTTITIGKETYVFAVGSGSKYAGGTNVVDLTSSKADDSDLQAKAAVALSKAAANNTMFKVGADSNGTGRITLTEMPGAFKNYNTYDLQGIIKTANGTLKNSDGDWTGLVKIGTAKEGTGGLSLQIGDTSDSFNKLSVTISDIHTASLGIDDVDISTQAGASAAIDKIKAAINSVSSTRGDLGAIQNRLEHTSNNLSVMTENIQDAESTIRDTDIAEEMMSYTKNNILVQSAQAMLAQANSVPQGVLQLLQ